MPQPQTLERFLLELYAKAQAVLKSRKFWALVASLVAIAAAYSTGDVQVWQALTAVVAALAAYSTATAIEDNGRS